MNATKYEVTISRPEGTQTVGSFFTLSAARQYKQEFNRQTLHQFVVKVVRVIIEDV